MATVLAARGRLQYLGRGQGVAHGADGFCVIVSFLLHLQKLSGLDERLERLLGPTVHEVFVTEPLFQLTDIVPMPKIKRENVRENKRENANLLNAVINVLILCM